LIYILLGFVIVLGITITVHEFGHFAMAKLLKIRVLVFSLGFGPRLVGFSHGGTEYRLSPIPLGGYVKMAGEAYDEDRKGAPDEFLSHPKWHRFLVAIAGPFMNISLAILIGTFAYMQGVYAPRYFKEPAIVGSVVDKSIAQKAGLQSGDKIVTVNRNTVKSWEDMVIALGTAPKDSLNMAVERNGQNTPIHFASLKDNAEPTILGFKPWQNGLLVLSVMNDMPAQKAGIQIGDEILSVQKNGIIIRNYEQILTAIKESNGVPLKFEVFRPFDKPNSSNQASAPKSAGSILHLSITAVEEKKGHSVVGFKCVPPSDMEKFGLIGSFIKSIRQNYESCRQTFTIIGRIFKGTASIKSLSGPIEIAKYSGEAARDAKTTGNALQFFAFLGFVSLQLGVFNLLPIPILDGGVMALLVVEGLMRRDFSMNIKEKIVQVGFVFLILLMGFVIFNDLSKNINFGSIFK
jgi:regulator of sigma E protease